MTFKDFKRAVVDYYGPQRNVYVEKMTDSYLKKYFKDYDRLWVQLVRSFSTVYGKSPDIAIFEIARKYQIPAPDEKVECKDPWDWRDEI